MQIAPRAAHLALLPAMERTQVGQLHWAWRVVGLQAAMRRPLLGAR